VTCCHDRTPLDRHVNTTMPSRRRVSTSCVHSFIIVIIIIICVTVMSNVIAVAGQLRTCHS